MIFELVILLLSIPAGLYIAWAARDELRDGRPWFFALLLISVFGGIFCAVVLQAVFAWSLFFIAVVSLISAIKSYDKKWTKRMN